MFNFGEILSEEKANSLGGVVLAFIGDAVYSLFVREKLAENSSAKTGELNKLASAIVCATAQSERSKKLMEVFNEEEIAVFKRARNAKKYAKSKNATVADYNASTGFEAVLGYLYVTGKYERLDYLLNYEGA